MATPTARGPLLAAHQAAGATLQMLDGWQTAAKYPDEPARGAHALVDLSHRSVHEVNGPGTGLLLQSSLGRDLPVRTIHQHGQATVYRLSATRAIWFGDTPALPDAIDVTGGWATLALCGPEAAGILGKVTAIDLRSTTFPIDACCQGPMFGVLILFGRFDNRFKLHMASDSAQFIWDVLLDAGREFDLRPAGTAFLDNQSSSVI